MSIGVSHTDFVMIPVSDFDRAAAFYGDTIGLEPSKRWGDMPAQEFETGNLTLAIMDPTGFGRPFEGPSTATIALRVDDVAARRAQLEEVGVQFFMDTLDSGVCHMAIFADPDGNRLMLHNRYAPEAPDTHGH